MHVIYASKDAAEVSGLSVVLPPMYEVFWSTVILLLIWLVVGWAMPKLYGVIDKRQAEITAGLEAAENAQGEALVANRERQDLLREANEQARVVREKASKDAQRIIAQARQEALEEAARVSENAAKQIEADKAAAAQSLRQDVGSLATQLAEKIVGEQLKDKELSARVIDRFMDDLEEDLNKPVVGA